MKIVYLVDQTYLHGGIEKILSLKANYLVDKKDFEVFIITTEQKNKKSSYKYNSKIKNIDLGVNYRRNKSYFHPINFKCIFKNFVLLKRELKLIKPDVVISVSFSPDQYFLPFLGQKKIIKEIHFSGEVIRKGLNIIDKFLFQILIKYYNYLVLLNEDETRYFNFNNIRVIPNFVDFNKEKNDFNKRENIILSAGRIAPVKQFDFLIEAWSKIAKDLPMWKLHIYGNGEKKLCDYLNDLIVRLNVKNQTKIFEATDKLNNIMKKSKIFALTSKTECFPMVLLEAKSNGMACVSFDCPNGPKNIIEDSEDGILVRDQDINDFSIQLKRIIESNHLLESMSLRANENIWKFSTDNVMCSWLNLFNEYEV